jgi:Restriction endonuclease
VNMPPGADKWKHFERLVAAIHQAADQGAQVRWNETIKGRQFDVTIRFRRGLYDYLTVIECKDYGKPVAVEKVEAFVTKSADVQAHHAVMASASGFQHGARDVARRHNLTLIHVTDSVEVDLALFSARWTGTTEAFHIQSVELEYTGGDKKTLPDGADAMEYYVKHILIRWGSNCRTLDDIIPVALSKISGRWA